MSETDKKHMREDVENLMKMRDDKENRFKQPDFSTDYDKMVEVIYGMAKLIDPNSVKNDKLRELYPSLEQVTPQKIKDNVDHLILRSKPENKEDLARFCCIAGCMVDPKHNRCICRYP